MTISAGDFRAGMRQLAAAVNVITTLNAGQRGGMTATAVMSITADPPLLAIAVNRANASFEAIRASGIFAVNVLPHDHADLAGRFAGAVKGEERFATTVWGELVTGAPILMDSAAAFDCQLVQTVDFSSHALFIGRVEALRVMPTTTPLLYMDGTWASLVKADAANFQTYERVIGEIKAALDAALADATDPLDQLRQFSRAFTEVSAGSIEAVRDFFSRETFVPAARFDRINLRKREVEGKLRILLTRGAEAGEFQARDAALTADAIIGMLNSIHRYPESVGPVDIDAMGQRLADLVVAMVAQGADAANAGSKRTQAAV